MLRSRCLQEIYVSQYDVLTSIAYQLSDFLCVCVCFLLQLCCFFILLPLQKSLHCPLKSKCHHIQATVSKKHASVVDKSKKKNFFMTFFCLTSLLFSLFIIIIWNLHTVIEFCVDQQMCFVPELISFHMYFGKYCIIIVFLIANQGFDVDYQSSVT